MDVLFTCLAFLIIIITPAFFLKLLPFKESKKHKGHDLPPGPVTLPIIGNVHQLGFILAYIPPALHRFQARYGTIFRVSIGKQIMVFIANHELAQQTLVQTGTTLAGRPPSLPTLRIFNANQHSINSANYGPLWRLLRRNLTAEVLNPSRIKHFHDGRRWAIDVLLKKLRYEAERNGEVVMPIESFRHSIFSLLFFMCFGEKHDEVTIHKVEKVLLDLFHSFSWFLLLGIFPRLISKIFLWRQWHHLTETRRNEELTLLPFIRARSLMDQNNRFCYLDTLLALEHPEGRQLDEGEIVTLCAEFVIAGTDTTTTILQWVVANLVKDPKIQAKLYDEIVGIVGDREEVADEDLQRMPYLKAVILEALRRHPPVQLLLPHATTEQDVHIAGYHIPNNAFVNVMIGDLGLDEKVWTVPMEFRPKRFMPGGEAEDLDITGTKKIKMIPFGAGRRMCPGMGMAMLHLQYYVANLIRKFEWLAVEGEEVDLTDKCEINVVMKHPLKARLARRDQIGTS